MAKLAHVNFLILLVICCAVLPAGYGSSGPSYSDDPNATDPGTNAEAGVEAETNGDKSNE